jgi:hypothetical protein
VEQQARQPGSTLQVAQFVEHRSRIYATPRGTIVWVSIRAGGELSGTSHTPPQCRSRIGRISAVAIVTCTAMPRAPLIGTVDAVSNSTGAYQRRRSVKTPPLGDTT